jgi:TolB-like protein/Flp pilus assembly protein TadD
MSDDSKQEYFCDGITEDLITDLSKISGLFVIARNSTFIYKGKAVKIRQVAEELGVRYVLEGGVRKADKNVRITAQLIDATAGHHLWAERYDGKLENIFKLQDEITRKIVSALSLKLTEGEQKTLKDKDTDNIAAYDALLKGWSHYLRFTPEDFSKAISHFKKAIDLDPNYGRAYAGLARVYEDIWTHTWEFKLGLIHPRKESRKNLEMAMKRNPSSFAHQASAKFLLFRRQYENALAEAQYAITLDPNDPACYATMGWILIHANRIQEAIRFIERGMRLDPQNPGYYLYLLGHAQTSMGNYEQAVTLIERALRYNPSAETAWGTSLAVAYAHLGHIREAEACLDAFAYPCKVKKEMLQHPYDNQEVTELFAEGLRKAGCQSFRSDSYLLFEDNKLTEKELKDLLSDRQILILSSADWTGVPSNNLERWIEGDLLCYQLLEFPLCGPVFRNLKNKSRMINEYFYLNDFWIFPFYVD